MPRFSELPAASTIQTLTLEEGDWNGLAPETLRHMLFHILLIREVELALLDLKDQNQVHGPVHSSVGQEGTAVGAMQLLDREDQITSTHRGHHHFLAKAYNAYAGESYDPTAGIPREIAEVTERAMAEILGLAAGYCRGRGGSMHLGDRYSGCIGTNAIVAGGVPCAAGAAWAQRIDGTGRIGVAFLGDGAFNQGVVSETMNMSALWRIPVTYFVENNLYAVATHVKDAFSVAHLAHRAQGHGIPSLIVDGMDPVAVVAAMDWAKSTMKSEEGPVLIEALNYRFRHQAQSLPGSAYGYRTKKEESQWEKKDPCRAFPAALIDSGALTKEGYELLLRQAREIVLQAVEALTSAAAGAPGGAAGVPADAEAGSVVAGPRVLKEELFPDENDLWVGIRSDGHEFDGVAFATEGDLPDGEDRKLIDVIPEVIQRRMDEDESIIIMGEEVGKMKGGVFMATKGIFKIHPDRVVSTPISEGGFSGMALGLALMGKRPIVELMYPDFTLVAADQIFNQIGKFRYMYGNQSDIPIVFRTKVGIGTGYGAQHSMEPAPLYGLFPGWRIVAPSNPHDYVGLFNSAMRCLDPVFVIEHANLYEETGPVSDDRDYMIELGKARVARVGSDVSLISYSFMTCKVLEAAEALAEKGISCEVIDLRSVDYANIDYETIGTSLAKTGRAVICEEGLFCGGIGGQMSYEIQRRFFDLLDGEIERVAGRPVPVPVSRKQEERAVPSAKNVIETVLAIKR